MQAIADEAGVAKGTLYLYFRDRDDLIEQAIRPRLRGAAARGSRAVLRRPPAAARGAARPGARAARVLRRAPGLPARLLAELREPDGDGLPAPLAAAAVRALPRAARRAFLAAAVRRGEMKPFDPARVALFFAEGMSAIVKRRLEERGRESGGGRGVDRGAAAGRHCAAGGAREDGRAGAVSSPARLSPRPGARGRRGPRPRGRARSPGRPRRRAQRTRSRFDEALRRALAANLGLGRARAEVGGRRRAAKRGALSQVLPRVEATGGLIRNDRRWPSAAPTSRRRSCPRNDWNMRLTAQPADLRGPARAAGLPAGEGGRALGRARRARSPRTASCCAPPTDYLTVVGGDALRAGWREQTLALAQDRLKQARDFFEAGETTRVDVLRAESAVKTAERQRRPRPPRARGGGRPAADRPRPRRRLRGQRARARRCRRGPTRRSSCSAREQTRGDVAQARSAPAHRRARGLEAEGRLPARRSPPTPATSGRRPRSRPTATATPRCASACRSGSRARSAPASRSPRERQRQARLAYEEARRARAGGRAPRPARPGARPRRRLALSQEQLAAAEAEYAQVSDLYRQPGGDLARHPVLGGQPRRRAPRRGRQPPRAKLLSELGVHFAAGDLKSAVLKEAQP